ncbi:hypothetical protein [Mesorhizobium sp. M00.F.Ca.ET.216.01.1.1]|uniref:hypothetical protein n=1 Tax=Mesorhizobium sp. M00.F.Ca.ET.216.01.1.1 TaxID=2500528 RepID=UPI001FDFC2F6|nr:hypothetical protein [Mesorhizobium sp. M00.F.Ca.ET.216.01.1.1]
MRTGHCQHARIHVEASTRAASTDAVRREPRHDTGAARDIEHALARLKPSDADEIVGHRRTKRW